MSDVGREKERDIQIDRQTDRESDTRTRNVHTDANVYNVHNIHIYTHAHTPP